MIHHATDLSVGTGQTKWAGSWQTEESRKATPARAGNEGAWLEGRVAAPLRSHSIVSDDPRHHRYLGTPPDHKLILFLFRYLNNKTIK
jgi:hypothetical protein